MWADYFAKMGACSHKVGDSFVAFWSDQLAIGRNSAKFFGWAAAQHAAHREVVGGQLEALREMDIPRPAADVARFLRAPPLLRFQEHDFWRIDAFMVCRSCLARAKTEASRKLLTQGSGRECNPSPLQRERARLAFAK
eukprot:7421896-Pyramimonas_sp.AAC.1